MSIVLNPGVRVYVQIQDSHDAVLYHSDCNSIQEGQEFIRKHQTSRIPISFLQGAIIPSRIDNSSDFAKDFFLPTFVNFALKINHIALKIFVSAIAVVFDVLTFPVRIVLTPFRYIFDVHYKQEKHPIMQLIENNPQAVQAIEKNVVNLKYYQETIELEEPDLSPDVSWQNAKKTVQVVTIKVAMKTLPGFFQTKSVIHYDHTHYSRLTNDQNDPDWFQTSNSSSSSFHDSFAF